MTPVLFSFSDCADIGDRLVRALEADIGEFEHRYFPDGESFVRVDSAIEGRPVVICSTLSDPDQKLLPLVFLAETCRELGARSVALCAPYLAYMRQDRRFNPGEAVTSRHFAKLICLAFDSIVTTDPHLHRIHDLNDLYPIASRTVHAAPAISEWIRDNLERPVIVGPDEESEQWVSEVARAADAPWIVLQKTRHGDRDVTISVPDVDQWRQHTPVLVDDIISTARTMIETVGHILAAGMTAPVCVGVHAVFAGDAYASLQSSGVARVATCNTIPHESNAIDITPLLADALRELL